MNVIGIILLFLFTLFYSIFILLDFILFYWIFLFYYFYFYFGKVDHPFLLGVLELGFLGVPKY